MKEKYYIFFFFLKKPKELPYDPTTYLKSPLIALQQVET
jgi:hypothetical protein